MNQGDKQKVDRIYFHWSGTNYNWMQPNHYHTIFTGDGLVHRMHDYHTYLPEHTAGRNSNAVALSLSCMGGTGFTQFPPTTDQIEAMCQETASLAVQEGWSLDPNILQYKMMTHAEAAALRDFPLAKVRMVSGLEMYQTSAELFERANYAATLGLPHDNYGPSRWPDHWPGGYQERWDLFKLKAQDTPGSGGHQLRIRVLAIMQKMEGAK